MPHTSCFDWRASLSLSRRVMPHSALRIGVICVVSLGLLSPSCNNDKSSEQAPVMPTVNCVDSNHARATELIATLTLTPYEREKLLEKLMRETGEETGKAFFKTVDSSGYRKHLAELYSCTFSPDELILLTRYAENSRIVRLSLLTAPHSLTEISGMGSKDSSDESLDKKWERLRDEVEFFGITSIEEFKKESFALRQWDTLAFLEKLESLKIPLIELINTHLLMNERLQGDQSDQ